MTQLTLQLLGTFQVYFDGQPIQGFEYNKVRALLAYLVMEADRPHHREVIAERLWPEKTAQTGRNSLRTALSKLRKAIGDQTAVPPFLLVNRDTVQFNVAAAYTLDVANFTDHVHSWQAHHPNHETICADCLENLAVAANLYQGDFLDQFFLDGSPDFDSWLEQKRAQLHRQALLVYEQLARYYESQQRPEQALNYARRQLELEPWHEAAHRQVMRLNVLMGRRSAALEQYEICRLLLADELGLAPSPETTGLHDQIRAGQEPPAPQTMRAEPGEPTSLRNPFARRTMLTRPEEFYGRKRELAEIYTLLNSMQSCSVVGARRIGKSSLLYYLTQTAVYTQALAQPERYIFVFIDLQELAGLGPTEFFETIVERFGRARPDFPIEPDRDSTLPGFRRFLLRAGDAGLRLVICCDEFEMLSQNRQFSADFFTYLRGLCSNYDLALVTSSQSSLFDLCHQGNLQTSQFWNIFVERSLTLMTPVEARDLLQTPFQRAGLALPSNEADFLLALTGPHPFFIQLAAFHLFDGLRQGQIIDRQKLTNRFLDEARQHYIYTWERLIDEEQAVLLALTHGIPPLPTKKVLFAHLQRQALLVGKPEAARLAADGWRLFLGEREGL